LIDGSGRRDSNLDPNLGKEEPLEDVLLGRLLFDFDTALRLFGLRSSAFAVQLSSRTRYVLAIPGIPRKQPT
jgi:hypothetical protein